MKHLALYLGIAASLVASCSIQDEIIESQEQDEVKFYASFEQPGDDGTKVYANENLHLRWNADDRVSIFDKVTYNQQYQFTGETGANAGEFQIVNSDVFVTGNAISHKVSVYPYQKSTVITEDEVLTVTLPAEQSYAENTFGLGANTMVSVSSDNLLQFKNVGGYLMLKLYGEGVSVSSITLKGNNEEKIAGKASVTMPLDGVPTCVMSTDAITEITLTCKTPVQLGTTAEGSSEFWFVLPPVTFSEGFTVSVTETSGSVFEKSTSKSITIKRNNLARMSPMEVCFVSLPVPEAVDLGLPSGLKWASFNLGASKPEEYGEYYSWGETEPKDNYDGSSYKWCMESVYELTKYCLSSSYGYNGFTDSKTALDPEDDAAFMSLGDKWRLPSFYDWLELQNHCTFEWTSMNGINGRKVTGPNGNSIFLPATGFRKGSSLNYADSNGFYWSSNNHPTWPYSAWGVSFNSEKVERITSERYIGRPIRPVSGDLSVPVEEVRLDKTELSLTVRATATISAIIIPSNASNTAVSWSSNDESVATVSSSGVVTAVSEGTTIITAMTSDGVHFANCYVFVSESTVPIPEAVDLGLSVKWASFNLGASKPEEYGDYYAWGETEPKDDYSWSSYKWCMGSYKTMTKYCSDSSYGYNGFTDTKTILDLEDDAAYVNLGGKWRMPTYAEWEELINNCTWSWTIQNGVNGRLVTASNGNSIFLPAAGNRSVSGLSDVSSFGYYWYSSLRTIFPSDAWYVYFDSGGIYWNSILRLFGYSVRPVYAE